MVRNIPATCTQGSRGILMRTTQHVRCSQHSRRTAPVPACLRNLLVAALACNETCCDTANQGRAGQAATLRSPRIHTLTAGIVCLHVVRRLQQTANQSETNTQEVSIQLPAVATGSVHKLMLLYMTCLCNILLCPWHAHRASTLQPHHTTQEGTRACSCCAAQPLPTTACHTAAVDAAWKATQRHRPRTRLQGCCSLLQRAPSTKCSARHGSCWTSSW